MPRRSANESHGAKALASDDFARTDGRAWDDMRRVLDGMSATRASNGSTPAAIATFVFSVKQPLFSLPRTRARCILSGIRSQIAHTIVHLGIDLDTVLTKASLADAFLVALEGPESSA